MINFMVYALLGNISENFVIRRDDKGSLCLYTNYNKKTGIIVRPIQLHFGTVENYEKIMMAVEEILENFKDKSPELAYRAELLFRYKYNQTGLPKDMQDEHPKEGSIEETIQVQFLRYSDLKNLYDREENYYKISKRKYKKEEHLEKMNELKQEIDKIVSELIGLGVDNNQVSNIIMNTPTFFESENNNKNSIMNEITAINKNKAKGDSINELIVAISNVQTVAEDAEIKKDLEKELIYRCVGIGTEGTDSLFPLENGENNQAEQIKKFIISQGIDIPDLDQKIQEAFEYKEMLKEDGWSLGEDTLTVSGFIELLKQSMIQRGLTFDDIDTIMEYYIDLDMFYGNDVDICIDEVSNIIKEVMNGDTSIEEFDELFEYICDNNIEEFFENLKILIENQSKLEKIKNFSSLEQARGRRDAAIDKRKAALELKRRAKEELAKKKGKAHNDE